VCGSRAEPKTKSGDAEGHLTQDPVASIAVSISFQGFADAGAAHLNTGHPFLSCRVGPIPHPRQTRNDNKGAWKSLNNGHFAAPASCEAWLHQGLMA
jgi:hypothetical protein